MLRHKWILGVAVLLAIMVAVPAMAAEKVINLPITGKVIAPDRNGNTYVRLIVGEKRVLNGVEYEVGTAAMAFGPVVEGAKALEVGQTLKAIVQERTYQGRDSYTILKLL